MGVYIKNDRIVHGVPKCSLNWDMFKNIIKMIGHQVFSQATGCDKMTHFVWILQEKNLIMWLNANLNDRIVK